MSIQQIFPFNNHLVRRFLNWKQGDEEDTWRNKAVETLIKKLKRQQPSEQYTNLQLALNRKSEDTPCITLPRSQDGRLQVSHRKMLPHVMYCRIFRWPDLQSQHELRPLPSCPYSAARRETTKICVNPYHYLRVDHSIYPPVVTPRNTTEFTNASPPPLSPGSATGMPPGWQPPYDQYTANGLFDYVNSPQQSVHSGSQPHMGFAYASQSPTSESNYGGSVGPNGEIVNLAESPRGPQFDSQTPPPRYVGRDQQLAIMPMESADESQQNNAILNSPDESQDYWCRITYAELNQKIGEPFKGSSQQVFVDGFTNPSVHNHNRFSLGVISNINRNSTIEMTRRAIRKGVCLENVDNQIYVWNLSESSIYFHSKNCNVENQLHHHAVVRIASQGSHKIFDQRVFEDLVQEAIRTTDGKTSERLYSLIEHCIIKMSFVKGWGAQYQRQDVTSTPCWIEICLLKPCALIDQYLQQTGPPTAHITSTS